MRRDWAAKYRRSGHQLRGSRKRREQDKYSVTVTVTVTVTETVTLISTVIYIDMYVFFVCVYMCASAAIQFLRANFELCSHVHT